MDADVVNSDDSTERCARVFGRAVRLRTRQQLDFLRENGQKSAGKLCVLVIVKTPPDGTRKVAFLISRKYSLLAVERNRARRLFREAYRAVYRRIPSAWMAFIPRQRMKTAKMADVYDELCVLLHRLGIEMAHEECEQDGGDC